MSILELQKQQLHHWVESTDDAKLLQKMMDLVSQEEDIMQRIERGRQELSEGKTVTHEEAKKRTAEWLKGKA